MYVSFELYGDGKKLETALELKRENFNGMSSLRFEMRVALNDNDMMMTMIRTITRTITIVMIRSKAVVCFF